MNKDVLQQHSLANWGNVAYYMYETCALHVFYTCITCVWYNTPKHHTCITYVGHMSVMLLHSYIDQSGKCTQRRARPDQCYFTVQITGINFEYSL